MQITWHGASCFSIATKTATLVTDPTGTRKADITLLSHPGDPATTSNNRVDWPGEYELQDIFIVGIPAGDADAGTLYALEAGNVNVGFFAAAAGKLTVEQVEQLGDIDVLLLPVGAGGLEPAAAKTVLEQIEPRMLIPMGDDAEARQKFVDELGLTAELVEGALKVEDRDLPQETMRLVVLSPAS